MLQLSASVFRRNAHCSFATIAVPLLLTVGLSLNAAGQGRHEVLGAGRTIIEGRTGGATPIPVTTILAFHADKQGGDFECLALAPAQGSGTGSGAFDVNAMYVTGTVTSVEVIGDTANLHGTATVTGIGAGSNVPFTMHVRSGGPGTQLKLEVSGLVFRETLLEGQILVK